MKKPLYAAWLVIKYSLLTVAIYLVAMSAAVLGVGLALFVRMPLDDVLKGFSAGALLPFTMILGSALLVALLEFLNRREGGTGRIARILQERPAALRFVATIVAAFGLVVTYFVTVTYICNALGFARAPDILGSGIRSGGTAKFIGFFGVIVIAAPISEELLFRGYFFEKLRSHFSAITSILMTSVIFASLHFDGSVRTPLAIFGMGLVLGTLRERSGGFLTPMALHALNNLFAFVLSLWV